MRFHEGSARHARETLNGKLAEKLLRTKLTWCLSVYRLKERRCFRIFCVNCVLYTQMMFQRTYHALYTVRLLRKMRLCFVKNSSRKELT